MKNVYVFGNEYLREDCFAKEVIKYAGSVNIVFCRSPDDLLDAADEEIIILDVLKNAKEPIVITNVSQLKTRKILTLHDFDVAFFLRLIDKLGIKKNIRIIGVPQYGDPKTIAEKIKAWL